MDDRYGQVVEATLVASKHDRFDNNNEMQYYQGLAEGDTQGDEQKERAEFILRVINDMSIHDMRPVLGYIVKKIELAAQFGER